VCLQNKIRIGLKYFKEFMDLNFLNIGEMDVNVNYRNILCGIAMKMREISFTPMQG